MQPQKLDFIDSLRGLASLYVVFFHLSLITKPEAVPPSWLAPFIGTGGSGVMLFFVVSAFTLCLSMESRAVSEAAPITNFYLRRFFRIAPLFYFWMIIYYFRDIWYYHDVHPFSEVAPSLFFYLNIIPGQEEGYVWASWTIGAEMLFYAAFPLIFAYSRNIGMAFGLFLIALALRIPWHGFVLRFITDPGQNPAHYYDYSIIFNLGVFLFGIVVYHLYKLIDPAKTSRFGTGQMLLAVFVAGTMWECYDTPSADRTINVAIQTVIYSALLLGLAITPAKIFVNRVTRFYGKISYSVYLSHATTVFFMSPIFGWVYQQTIYKTLAFAVSVGLAMAVITPLSYLTYRYIEAPGNDLGRHLIRRMAAPKLA
jgi:peptidoglycan/LPS O-acetylase OafA/YrhL